MNNQAKILHMIKQADPQNPLEYARSIVKDYARDKLDSYIIENNTSQGSRGPSSITKGNVNADVMIIGEAVSVDQLALGKDIVYPMEGTEAEEMLLKVLDYYHVNSNEVFYMNAVNMFPNKEIDGELLPRTPSKSEVMDNKVFLDYAIDIVRPSLIILLGSVALNLFKKEAITKARGEWFDVRGIPAMATYHPEYFVQIRDKKHPDMIDDLKHEFVEDIGQALLYIQNNYPNNNVLLESIEQ